MIRRGDKTGQFYLITAIILAAIIIGIVTVSNYSRKETRVRLDDLQEELKIESLKVLDHGISNELSATEMNELLQNFVDNYTEQEKSNKDLYFIFGNREDITVKGYQRTAKNVSIDGSIITQGPEYFIGNIDPLLDEVDISIGNLEYNFEIKPGENFYFIISQKIGEEEYVVTG